MEADCGEGGSTLSTVVARLIGSALVLLALSAGLAFWVVGLIRLFTDRDQSR